MPSKSRYAGVPLFAVKDLQHTAAHAEISCQGFICLARASLTNLDCPVALFAMQSAAMLQTPNEASVEAFEQMDPAVETTNPRELLTTEDIKAADAVGAATPTIMTGC